MIFQSRAVKVLVGSYIQGIVHALFMLVSLLFVNKPFVQIRSTLKSLLGAGNNV